MKKILMTAAIALACYGAQAQGTSSAAASQSVDLVIDGIITISNPVTGLYKNFAVASDLSGTQSLGNTTFTVQSNEYFNVTTSLASLSWASNGFTESTAVGDNETMPVGVVSFSCTDNTSAGGTNIAPSATSFTGGSQSVLNNCPNGGSQSFTMHYDANPGWTYAAGDYSGVIVTTATQE